MGCVSIISGCRMDQGLESDRYGLLGLQTDGQDNRPFPGDINAGNSFRNFNISSCFYQYGWERCTPAHQFGPAARTHYLFHYVISGTGLLMAQDQKERQEIIRSKADRDFFCIRDRSAPISQIRQPMGICLAEIWWITGKRSAGHCRFSKDQPIYHAVSKEYREIMMNEMLYIANHPDEPPFHLIGHSYLFWMRSSVPPPLPGW